MQAFLKCASVRSASDWECGADHEAAVRDGACEREQESVAACLERTQPD
jgi:hypothetical protein